MRSKFSSFLRAQATFLQFIVAGEGLWGSKRLCSVQSTRHMDGLLYGVQRCRIPYIEVLPRKAWNVSRVGDHLMFLIFFIFLSS